MWISASGKKVKEDEPDHDLPTEMLIIESYVTSGPLRFWKRQNTEANEILDSQVHSHASPDYRHFRGIFEETEGYSPSWAGYSSALHWVYPPCSSRCSRLKRTRECLTVARGQGIYRVYTPCTCELIPVPTYPMVCILYLTIAQILAMVQRPEACSFTHNWAPPRLGCSTFSCNFMLFNLCNMAELSQGLREHPYPGKDCWV